MIVMEIKHLVSSSIFAHFVDYAIIIIIIAENRFGEPQKPQKRLSAHLLASNWIKIGL